MIKSGFLFTEGTLKAIPDSIIHFSASGNIFEHLISLGNFLPWPGRIIPNLCIARNYVILSRTYANNLSTGEFTNKPGVLMAPEE